MKRGEFFRRWSELHGGAPITGIVRAWLSISYAITRPLIKLRISPDFLTFASILVGAFFIIYIEGDLAILLLTLSLLLDGIDGTVAIVRERMTRFGALFDAVADRIVEALWAYGLFLMGAPWQVVLIAWLAAFIQEYMRARSGGLGVTELLLVTWAERPVRASLIFIALVARAFSIDLVLIISIFWAALQSVSALVLLGRLRSQLQQSQR